MVQLDKAKIKEFVESNIKKFHESRLWNLENTKLKDLLKKNTITSKRILRPQPDWAYIHQELKRKGVTLTFPFLVDVIKSYSVPPFVLKRA